MYPKIWLTLWGIFRAPPVFIIQTRRPTFATIDGAVKAVRLLFESGLYFQYFFNYCGFYLRAACKPARTVCAIISGRTQIVWGKIVAPFENCLIIVSTIQVTLTADRNSNRKTENSLYIIRSLVSAVSAEFKGFKKEQQQTKYVWKWAPTQNENHLPEISKY